MRLAILCAGRFHSRSCDGPVHICVDGTCSGVPMVVRIGRGMQNPCGRHNQGMTRLSCFCLQMASFKAIIKKNRVLKILQRLKCVREARHKDALQPA